MSSPIASRTGTSPIAIGAALVAGAVLTFAGLRLAPRASRVELLPWAPTATPTPISTETPTPDRMPVETMIDGEVFIVAKSRENYKLALVEVTLFPIEPLLENLKSKEQRRVVEQARLEATVTHAKTEADARKRARDKAQVAADEQMNGIRFHPDAVTPRDFTRAEAALETARKAQKVWVEADTHYVSVKAESDYYSSGGYYLRDLPPAIRITKTNSDGRFSMTVPTTGKFAVGARAERTVGDKIERYFWLVEFSVEGKAKGDALSLSNDNLTSAESRTSLIHTAE